MPTFGCSSPIVLQINHIKHDPKEKYDLSIYMSMSTKEPNVTQCSQSHINKKTIKFHARHGAKNFLNTDVLYLCF
jgi:hypothetical protein